MKFLLILLFPFLFAGRVNFISSGVTTPDIICGANLKTWVKADQITANDGDDVSTWSDQSGNAYNYTSNVAAPKYKVNIQNSLPAVLFNGTSSGLKQSTSVKNVITLTAATMYMVLRVTSVQADTGTRHTNAGVWDQDQADYGSSVASYTGTPQFATYAHDGSFHDLPKLTFSTGTTYVFTVRHGAGTMYHSINNGTEQSASVGSLTDEAAVFRIGQNFGIGGTNFMAGYIMEQVVCNVALDASGQAAMQTYLNTKWAVY